MSAEPREPATVEKRTNTGVVAPVLQERRRAEVVETVGRLERAVRAGAAGVHDPLGDALVVEVHDLLAEVEVLEQRRAPLAGRQRVVGVVDPQALRGGQAVARLRPRRATGAASTPVPVAGSGALPAARFSSAAATAAAFGGRA